MEWTVLKAKAIDGSDYVSNVFGRIKVKGKVVPYIVNIKPFGGVEGVSWSLTVTHGGNGGQGMASTASTLEEAKLMCLEWVLDHLALDSIIG